MCALEVPDSPQDEWLQLLKPYQRSTVLVFLANSDLEAAAEKWLEATGPANIVPFGGVSDPKPFWERFRSEFRRFLCDDQAYVEDKQALGTQGPVNKALLVGMISAAVGSEIGLAPSLLTPAVVLLLCAVGKVGRNAYCSAGTEPVHVDAETQTERTGPGH
jgi:hypothetical protein